MNIKTYIYAGAGLVFLLIIVGLVLKYRPRKINTSSCSDKWQAVQKHCADKKTWHLAVTDADRLLDDVLKRRHYKGKTTGERLVSAQHAFSNNESLWFGHKLYNRIHDDGLVKISKQDTLEALGGFRQALKDLGALQDKIITAPTETVPATIIIEPEATETAAAVEEATK
ncbi:MAG: hypothetical protein QFB87_03160 [Patescibacteria group bacterium]|nr:hypothetical protein [Patescibacteria group bacterium]